ncbi:MAG: hypothetical protein V7645_1493 [Actinomycetota bacterium]
MDEPLRLNEKESVILGFVSDFYALLGAIDETMPNNSVLCLEGTSVASDVAVFLEQRQASERPAIKANTLWPKPRLFHLPLADTNLNDLRSLAENHAEPEIADHLMVYRDRSALLWAHDAGSGYVALSRSLPEGTIQRFHDALGSALRPGE